MMGKNWAYHQKKPSTRRFDEPAFSPNKDNEGFIFEGEFEEITTGNQGITQPEKQLERRICKERRVRPARPLFETRASDRRKSQRILDIYA